MEGVVDCNAGNWRGGAHGELQYLCRFTRQYLSSETLALGRIQMHSFSAAFIKYSKRLEKGIQLFLGLSGGGEAHM